MSFVINTNVMSLVAQQNLNQSQNMLNQAIERLSSGRKINSAADDAAGLAISNRMTAQINGLGQARANANDGISLAQTTEGALDQINDNLQRIRELTVQAENGTNSSSDLTSIQEEINARLEEIDRVATQTSFNGVKVLASDQKLNIQVGANDGQTIALNLEEINSTTLKLSGFTVEADLAATTSDVVDALASGDSVKIGSATYTYQSDGSFLGSGTAAVSGVSFTQAELETAIVTASTGATVSGVTGVATISTDGAVSGTAGTAYVDNDGTFITATAATYDTATVNPLEALDNALKQVGSLRSDLGAIQNRFDSAINNISTSVINLTSARSRIVDADYAVAVSQMSKAQILQQAGTSVLAQANQSQQGVLSLLR